MVKERLASSVGRRDEEPNLELAQEIVENQDLQSIEQLIALLKSKQKELQNDSIKVLYEIGELNPRYIEKYIPEFLEAVLSKNNRLQWGAMTALKTISTINQQDIFENLSTLENVVNLGSVITRDNFVGILANLMDHTQYQEQAFLAIQSQLIDCPTNQFPMYAEILKPKINGTHISAFREIILNRIDTVEKESKRKRLEKILKKLK